MNNIEQIKRVMQGVRVEGDTVIIKVIGGNDAARWLCGELVAIIDSDNSPQVEIPAYRATSA